MDLRKKGLKASLTVEACFAIVMTIFLIGIMISLWIYKFQACWYTQAVSECLLLGNNKVVLHEQEYINDVKRKWREVKEENYLVPEDLMTQIQDKKDKISMEVNGRTPILGYGSLWLEMKLEMGIVKPVTYVRKMTEFKEAVGT